MHPTPRHFIVLVTIFFIKVHGFHGGRNKRTLIFIPPRSIVQMVMGVGLPLVLQEESVIVGMVLKWSYELPDNSTIFTNPGVVYAKKKRSVNRWDLYEVMEQIAEMHGLVGKECLLRAICEVADVPIDNSKGLFEELVHVILTPSSTQENVVKNADHVYHAAEQIGKNIKGSCGVIFPECRVSLAEMFTKFSNF